MSPVVSKSGDNGVAPIKPAASSSALIAKVTSVAWVILEEIQPVAIFWSIASLARPGFHLIVRHPLAAVVTVILAGVFYKAGTPGPTMRDEIKPSSSAKTGKGVGVRSQAEINLAKLRVQARLEERLSDVEYNKLKRRLRVFYKAGTPGPTMRDEIKPSSSAKTDKEVGVSAQAEIKLAELRSEELEVEYNKLKHLLAKVGRH